MQPLMVPQYDAAIVAESTAYPVGRDEAERLVRVLTGRSDAEPVEWERTKQVTFVLDGIRYQATFAVEGWWPVKDWRGDYTRHRVAITDVRTRREE